MTILDQRQQMEWQRQQQWQQQQAWRQWEQQQRQQQQQQHEPLQIQDRARQDIYAGRNRFFANAEKQGMHTEKLGNATALRDKNGLIRDIGYAEGGDVTFRAFKYDQNNQVNRMVVDSKARGMQIWEKQSDGKWLNRLDPNSGAQNFDVSVDQKTGLFTCKYGNTEEHYDTSGRRYKGNAPSDGGADRGGTRGGAQQGSDTTFEDNLKKTFGPTEKDKVDHRIKGHESYKENLWNSAAEGRPVVMTFGRSSDPANQQVMENLQKSKEAAGGKADFMFVDIDKVDPKSEIGQYVNDHIKGKWQTPMTMVFTQHQGKPDEPPVIPDKPTHWQAGSLDSSKLNDAISQAVASQKPLDVPDHKKGDASDNGNDKPPAKIPTAEDLLVAMKDHAWDAKYMRKMLSGVKSHQAQSLLMEEAINLADEREKSATGADKESWKAMANVARASYGLVNLDYADQYANRNILNEKIAEENALAAKACYRRGMSYLLTAGERDHSLYKDAEFRKAVLNSKLPGQAAETILARGSSDPNWFHTPNEQDMKTANPGEAAINRHLDELEAAMKLGSTEAQSNNNYGDIGVLLRRRAAKK